MKEEISEVKTIHYDVKDQNRSLSKDFDTFYQKAFKVKIGKPSFALLEH